MIPPPDDLETIPGVGPSIAQDLRELGIRRVRDLRRRNPERLYDRLCDRRGKPIDRCVLYVFRGAVYFASHTDHDPDLLRWWAWSDRALAARERQPAASR
jgi:hypothetical protein